MFVGQPLCRYYAPVKTAPAISTLLIVFLCGLSSCTSQRPVRLNAPGAVWSSALVPCTPQLCGGVAGNSATFRLSQGDVWITSKGTVAIRLKGLTDRTTGATLRGQILEVWQGAFTTRGFEGGPVNPVGTVITNEAGDYEGPVHMTSGQPFVIAPARAYSTQFALNDPSVRTQFVTGFVVQ